ncbi:MAG: hypothetical protein SW833_14600 [Cyanobacteriota bacterium]|nr:hypothetical protein [Cyanobacteriota bacterium]
MPQLSLYQKIARNPSLAFRRGKRELENQIEDWVRGMTQRHIWSEVVNQKEIRVVGLRRTGNHALLNWIKEQEKGEVWHLNNVQSQENPYRYKYNNLSEFFPNNKWSIDRFKNQAKGNLTPKDCLIYNYEDYALSDVFSEKFEEKHDLYLGKTKTRYDVLVIRDPFNLLASRLKNNYMPTKDKNKNCIDLWIDYAKEYLGETQYLRYNKVCVNYNQWTTDIEYRKQIAQQLNLEFSDAGINKVSGCGGGSSFEGRALDGQANQLDIGNRWKHFCEDKVYRKLLDNEQLWLYSEQIFGQISGTEQLRMKEMI